MQIYSFLGCYGNLVACQHLLSRLVRCLSPLLEVSCCVCSIAEIIQFIVLISHSAPENIMLAPAL